MPAYINLILKNRYFVSDARTEIKAVIIIHHYRVHSKYLERIGVFRRWA